LLAIPVRQLQITISLAMLAVAAFILFNENMGEVSRTTSHAAEAVGYSMIFLLAIYGGFFSGGYATVLTVLFVVLFGMTFLEAIAITRVLNTFSSGVATLVFIWRGATSLELGRHPGH
jgi:uncharacterized protein